MSGPEFSAVVVAGALHAPAPAYDISDDDAQFAVAVALVTEICAQGITDDFEAAWDFLIHLPNYMVPLLETAQGWHILFEMAADAFGKPPCFVQPSIQ